MKKNKTVVIIAVAALALTLAAAGVLFTWKNLSDYTRAVEINWGLVAPRNTVFEEIYNKSSGASFHGDGIRYHVFSVENGEPLEDMSGLRSEDRRTVFYDSVYEAVDAWLDEIEVPETDRPDMEKCVYLYLSQEDNSELFALWNAEKNRLYIVESLL